MDPIKKSLSESQINKLKLFKESSTSGEGCYLSYNEMYNATPIKAKDIKHKERVRKPGGGRKGKCIDLSKFSHIDLDGLWFDDILTGCIRSYDNEKADTHRGHKFKPETIKTIFECCDTVTTKDIMAVTGLKERQSRNYMGVISLIVLFMERKRSTDITDYIDVMSLEHVY